MAPKSDQSRQPESVKPKQKRKTGDGMTRRDGKPKVIKAGPGNGNKAPIDEAMLEVMSRAQEAITVMADAQGVTADTLERRYGPQMKAWRAAGKMTLRREMYTGAINGNVALMIFYAKNYLGMSDTPDTQVNVTTNVELGITADQARDLVLDRLKQMEERMNAHPVESAALVTTPPNRLLTSGNGHRG